MEASTIGPEATAETREPEARQSEPRERRPLRTMLPTGLTLYGVAASGGALAVASFVDFGATGRAFVGAILCPVLLLLASIDVRHRLLPNAIVLPSALVIALIVAAANPGGLVEHLEAGLALFGFLFLFAAVFPAGIGMGDAKAGLLLGLALGYRTLSAMMAAFGLLFVAALWILVRYGWSARTKSIPFGPFLALGGILGFFFG